MYIYDRALSPSGPLCPEQPAYWHSHIHGLEQTAPDPSAGLKDSPRMQRRLKESVDEMQKSIDANDLRAASEILNGNWVVAFPPLLIDTAQNERVSLDLATPRIRNSGVPGQPKASITIFPHSQLDANGNPLPGQVGAQ